MSEQSELVGCDRCKGRKTLVGLGTMVETCSTCKGVGWVEKPSKKDEDEFLLKAYTKTELEEKADLEEPEEEDSKKAFPVARKKFGRQKKVS